MKMFVGNLSFDETEDALRSTFSAYGAVERIRIETNLQSGQSKGFGLVVMRTDEEGVRAIDGLNGKERNGKLLTVSCVGPYRGKGSDVDRKRRY